MYTEQYENNVNINTEQKQKKTSYSIKRLLKQLFKQHKSQQQQQQQENQQQQQQELFENYENDKKANSLESLESLENSRNADLESLADSCISMESSENDANERLAASCELEDYEFADITSVPVHFLRTAHGTFFWTANSDLPADNDLIEPLYCSTGNQLATTQMQDRWAQA